MKFTGKAITVLGEHVNLDTATGWYLGMDALPPAQLAAKFLAAYDPKIPGIVQKNDILVGGRNFGNGKIHASFFIGMKVLGINCIVAESFSTYLIDQSMINGINLLECPGISDGRICFSRSNFFRQPAEMAAGVHHINHERR